MTQQELHERNIAIAIACDDEGEFARDRQKAGTVETLQYHDSWEWLMPVFDRIAMLPTDWQFGASVPEILRDEMRITTHGVFMSFYSVSGDRKIHKNVFTTDRLFKNTSLVFTVWQGISDFCYFFNEFYDGQTKLPTGR